MLVKLVKGNLLKRKIFINIPLAIIFFLLFYLQGCLYIIYPDFDTKESYFKGDPSKNIIAYGYFEMDGVEVPLDRLGIRRVYPKNPDGEYTSYKCLVDKGVFVNGNLDPGSYMILSFCGGDKVFNLGSQSMLSYRMYRPGECYYLGAFRIKSDRKMLDNNEFYVERINSIDEKKVLRSIIKSAANSKWESILMRRMANLEGRS